MPGQQSLVAFKNVTLLPEAFYQQRYHASESETGPTVREFITSRFITNKNIEQSDSLLLLFQLNERLDESIIHLSTGEFRKLAIVLALLKKPQLLLLNEPYAGLDLESIEMLDSILLKLSKKRLNIILSSEIDHIPSFITHSLKLNRTGYSVHVGSVRSTSDSVGSLYVTTRQKTASDFSFKTAFTLHDLTIHDGHKKLLDKVNWSVSKGEKWALFGRNGTGKSMLLSVIFADHPQAYANHIILFDRPRGSGESIWEIREQIGYSSISIVRIELSF
jgi:molybdate transport system ATP-binding protein